MRGKLQGHGERRENKKLLLAVLLVVLLAVLVREGGSALPGARVLLAMMG